MGFSPLVVGAPASNSEPWQTVAVKMKWPKMAHYIIAEYTCIATENIIKLSSHLHTTVTNNGILDMTLTTFAPADIKIGLAYQTQHEIIQLTTAPNPSPSTAGITCLPPSASYDWRGCASRPTAVGQS